MGTLSVGVVGAPSTMHGLHGENASKIESTYAKKLEDESRYSKHVLCTNFANFTYLTFPCFTLRLYLHETGELLNVFCKCLEQGKGLMC